MSARDSERATPSMPAEDGRLASFLRLASPAARGTSRCLVEAHDRVFELEMDRIAIGGATFTIRLSGEPCLPSPDRVTYRAEEPFIPVVSPFRFVRRLAVHDILLLLGIGFELAGPESARDARSVFVHTWTPADAAHFVMMRPGVRAAILSLLSGSDEVRLFHQGATLAIVIRNPDPSHLLPLAVRSLLERMDRAARRLPPVRLRARSRLHGALESVLRVLRLR